jgi:hypothetical protein
VNTAGGLILPKKTQPIPELPDGVSSLSTSKRKVVTRSPHRSVGIMACSWVQDEGIEYESQLERRFLQQALLLPGLKRIRHQPFKIGYTDSGREKHYTPDFLLDFEGGERVLVEVKPDVFVKKNTVIFDIAKSTLSDADIPFFVITDKLIDIKNKVNNASLILRYGRGSIPQEKTDHFYQYGSDSPPTSIKEILQRFNLTFGDLLHLIARKKIFLPTLSQEINDETLIHFHKKDTSNATLLICDRFDATPW